MAVPKICGIETEYGILVRGSPNPNPIAASSLLINAYVQQGDQAGLGMTHQVGWDFEDETPGRDARWVSGSSPHPPAVDTHLVNAVLTNGARFYVDHAHPEFSSPECIDARQAVVYDRAGEEIVGRAIAAATPYLGPGEALLVHKNNSDGKGNSYGCHENYFMDRSTPFGGIVAGVTTHLVTRQLYCGAGKLGSEHPGRSAEAPALQLSQRADFIEEEVGLETTLKRPIVNTRDEPHADPRRYRRLHIIIGDANCSEYATLLKLGTTSIVLAMIEDGAIDTDLRLARPVQAVGQISRDIDMIGLVELRDGTTASALDLQVEYLRMAQRWSQRFGLESVGEQTGQLVLDMWAETLLSLERHPEDLADRVDWIAKRRLLEGFRERHRLDWSDPRLAALDLQYHDLRSERSLARRAGLRRVSTDEEVLRAVNTPPEQTRAWFRGRCLARFAPQIVAANWDSLVFDTGAAALKRVPMMDPQRGTRAQVGAVLDGAGSAAELIAMLGA